MSKLHCRNITFPETELHLLKNKRYTHVELDSVRFNEHCFDALCSILTPMTSLTSIIITGTVPLTITQGERLVRLLIENKFIEHVGITAFREYVEPYDPSQDPLVTCLEENKASFTSLSIALSAFTSDVSRAIIRSLKSNGTLTRLGIVCYSLPATHLRDLIAVLNVNSTLTHFHSTSISSTFQSLIDSKLRINITHPTLAGQIEKMRLKEDAPKHVIPLTAHVPPKRRRKQ